MHSLPENKNIPTVSYRRKMTKEKLIINCFPTHPDQNCLFKKLNMLNKQTNSVDSLVCVHSLMQILSVGLKITCSSHSAQHTVCVTIHRGALFFNAMLCSPHV